MISKLDAALEARSPAPEEPARMTPAGDQPSPSALRVVGIGASAGGLEAFTELLGNLGSRAGLAYVLVQHLDPTHRSLLTELLGKTTSLPVREITDGMAPAPNHVYVIPPNCDLTLEGGVLRLTPRNISGAARSIDHFFLSLARDCGRNAIGVILSGAGSDGAEGLRAVKQAGGVTFAQDQASARYDSMPRSAVATGCVDFVLPPDKIALEIGRLVSRPAAVPGRAAANARRRGGALGMAAGPRSGRLALEKPPAGRDAMAAELALRKIFFLLRSKTGVDFSYYRSNTIHRRLRRRMALNRLKSVDAYLQLLRRHPAELDALHQDFLINVTSFFRNPAVFEALAGKVFSKLVQRGRDGEAVRIWVTGCSGGQEAYSIAIAFAEFTRRTGVDVPVQIFATDVNPAILEQARAGRYTAAQVKTIAPARLKRYFVREGDGFRVQKAIRDRVIFAPQNLLTNPPFTRIDLITCRNLLIYLEPPAQQKILSTFHYALRPGGYLLLGTSETVGGAAALFEPRDRVHKIFQKKAAGPLRLQRPLFAEQPKAAPAPIGATPVEFSATDAQKEADRLLLTKFAPASVLVDANGDILQFRGEARRFLDLPSGKASFHLFKMARGRLSFVLQRGLARAKRTNRVVKLQEAAGGTAAPAAIQIVPLRNLKRSCFLVVFTPVAAPKPAGRSRGRGGGRIRLPDQPELRRELVEAREQLEQLQEEHDTSMEELQSSNEEVQSANEELQSLNEELETSNEELESANEELTTLNEELATRNAELLEGERRLREQAELLDLAPVLARSPKDRVIFWNRGAENLYGFTKEEASGQTSHLLLRAQYAEPLEAIQAKLLQTGRWEGEVAHRRRDGTAIWVASQWVAHYDESRNLRAVLEVNADITERKRAEEALHASERFNRTILESSPDAMMVLDPAGRVTYAGGHGIAALGLAPAAAGSGLYWPDLWPGEGKIKAEQAYRAALRGESGRFESPRSAANGAVRWWDVVVSPIADNDGRVARVLLAARDITEHKEAELAASARARLAALRAEVAAAIGRPGELDPILHDIADLLVRHVDARAVRIWVRGADAPGLELRASGGSAGAEHAPGESREAAEAVAATGQPRHEGRFASFPLSFNGSVNGVLALSGAEPFGPRVLPDLALTADALAQVIHRKLIEADRAKLDEEARVARGELEAKVGERTARLQETVSELQAFSYTVSHDLRAPLRAMQSYAQLLRTEFADRLDNNGQTYLARIEKAGQRLDRLILDVLTYSRLSQGPVKLVELDLRSLLENIVEQYPSFKPPAATVAIEGNFPKILGDESFATQCFSNLIGNAVKFVRQGEHPRVVIRCSESGFGMVRVWVEDNGIGIEPQHQQRIFRMFERAASDKQYDGTGIGLAIVRKAIERMGGEVGVLSNPGEGSRFWLDFRACA